jgi:hypothetical protein
MARKAIAAVLLLVIAAWAEMTLAPMLAMHAGHMSPGHEMAADMPMHHAGHHHSSPPPAKSTGHPCCPSLHRTAPPAEVLVLVSGSPACDDPHSCCFRQGPQSVPAPIRSLEKSTPDMAPAVITEVSPALGTARPALRDSALALRPPPDIFGMTLRI